MSRNIFLLGDSISIGYGPFLEQFLEGCCRLQRKSGMEEALRDLNIVAGANGGDSANCRDYLTAMIGSGQLSADLLLLNCGLHDVKCQTGGHTTQVSAADYRANLVAIVEMTRRKGLPLVWIRTTPVDEVRHNVQTSTIWRWEADVKRYNAIADEVMAEARVPSIDLCGFTSQLSQEGDRTTDGRHFPEATCRLQGAWVAGWVRGYFARKD